MLFPVFLLWQAWSIRSHAVIPNLSPDWQAICDTLDPSKSHLSIALSSKVSLGQGGQTLITGQIVLPANPSSLEPFLGGILAHEWAHRVQRHHLITAAYMVSWGLMIGTIGWILSANYWDHEGIAVLYFGSALSLFPLSRRLELAADAYVARNYSQFVPQLLNYFATVTDRPRNFFDIHPQPSRRMAALLQTLKS